jgi:hypothetical protein
MPSNMTMLPYSKFIITALLSFVLINISSATSQTFTKTPEIPSIRNDSSMRIETVSSGEIKFPTSMAFLAPDDILVLEIEPVAKYFGVVV